MTSLVSTAEVIARVPAAASLDSGALQLIIDANEVLLRSRDSGSYGASPITITVPTNRGTVVLLPFQFASLTTVKEHFYFNDPSADITLAADDWRLAPGGTALERLVDGTNPSDGFFADELILTGVVTDLTALRKNILIQLCAIDISSTADAGIKRKRLGDYEEERTDSAQYGPTAQKDQILAQLSMSYLPVFS